ncbi:FAD-dependent monooxygenase [Streptomyces sp. NPDC101132]|uniref:FAD-dependent monooxygenase n=1 Tax=Streptomyces sp. NPDC101132 TaxID=3366110 RepID=UPI00381D17C9
MSRIIIVGGGIGGLAAALSVSAQGHRVLVLERAPEFAEIGAGIQLAPNGLHALDRLGVGEETRAITVRMDELRFMDGVSGRHVTSLPLTEEYRERFGNPYAVVHRAELHRILLERCLADDRVELRGDCEVTGYGQTPHDATVLLKDGGRLTADAVIGADGINSAIRAQLVGDGAPRISGITVYRAVIPMAEVPAELRERAHTDRAVAWWAGPHCHLVHYPIAGGRHLNLAASKDDGGTEAFAGRPVDGTTVLREFAGLGDTARRLLALGRDWKTWMLVDRDPVDTWTDGRVALLGDAAHPMLHYAAQGACQALEDAIVLGELLDCPAGDFAARFEEYTALRRERTARVQLAARWSTALWHPSGEAAASRNTLLESLTPAELTDHVSWMHGVRDPLRDSLTGAAPTRAALTRPATSPIGATA